MLSDPDLFYVFLDKINLPIHLPSAFSCSIAIVTISIFENPQAVNLTKFYLGSGWWRRRPISFFDDKGLSVNYKTC